MSGHTITIRTDPTTAKQITALAEAMERSRNWVIEDAIKQYIETQAWQIEGIRDAMTALDKGEGIAHEEVMDEMDALVEEKIQEQESRT
jgi:predicted transcriptional regulator